MIWSISWRLQYWSYPSIQRYMSYILYMSVCLTLMFHFRVGKIYVTDIREYLIKHFQNMSGFPVSQLFLFHFPSDSCKIRVIGWWYLSVSWENPSDSWNFWKIKKNLVSVTIFSSILAASLNVSFWYDIWNVGANNCSFLVHIHKIYHVQKLYCAFFIVFVPPNSNLYFFEDDNDQFHDDFHTWSFSICWFHMIRFVDKLCC